MATLTLQAGQVSGTATDGSDTITAKKDTQSYIYTVTSLGGADTINLSSAYPTSYYQLYTGAGNDKITGGRGAFYDGSGDDVYHVKGDVQFSAGAGNDTYDGGSAVDTDTIDFRFAPSDDGSLNINIEGLVVDLAKTTRQDFGSFGKDILLSIENALGGDGNDKIYGTDANNQLNGSQGNDLLVGKAGNDTIFGDFGNDTIIGGKGADYMYGGGTLDGHDVFVFQAMADLGLFQANPPNGSRTWDTINEFEKGGKATNDTIDLKKIDTLAAAGDQGFTWIGSQAFHANAHAEIRISSIKESKFDTIKSTLVELDWDSDAKAEASFVVHYVTGLTKADFLL
jgi:Ca2+-binding RTX toxin-like protein